MRFRRRPAGCSYLHQLQEKRAKRALIISLDSSFPFSVGGRRLCHRSLPFSLLTFDFSRVPCIMEERATSFRSLQIEGVFPDDVSDDPRVLSQLKVGETYDVSYTESLAVAVTKGPDR